MKFFSNAINRFLSVTLCLIICLASTAFAAVFKGIEIPDTEPYIHSDILTSQQIETAKANFYEGFKFYNSKNYKMALDKFEKSIEIFPYENESFYWLSQAHYMLGDYPAAIEILKTMPKPTKFIQRRISYLESDKDLIIDNRPADKLSVKKAEQIKSARFDDKRFISPINVAAEDKFVFIVSSADKSVTIIDRNYTLIKKIGNLNFPYGIAINNGNLYISDFKDNTINVYSSKTFEFIKKIEIENYKPQGITNLTVDNKENIYFIDAGVKSIVKIDNNGAVLFKIENFSKKYFRAITDIKWHQNAVYALDGQNYKIFKFDETGNKLGEFNIEKKHTRKPVSLNIFDNDIVITDGIEALNNNKFAVYSLTNGEFTGYFMDIGKRANIVNLLINSERADKPEFIFDANNNELLKKVNDEIIAKFEFGREKVLDIALRGDTVFALIFPGNRIFEFSDNLQKNNELKIAIFGNNEIESFEIHNDLFIIKFVKTDLPVLLFKLNGEPVTLPFEDKNLCAFTRFKDADNTEVKAYHTKDNTYRINILNDTVFIGLKYITADSDNLFVLDDFNYKLNIYSKNGILLQIVDIPKNFTPKKMSVIENMLYIFAKKNTDRPLIFDLLKNEFIQLTNLPDKPLTSGACYRIIKCPDNYYFFIDFENHSLIALQYFEQISENYVIDIKNIDYNSMFPHIITNIKVRNAAGKNIGGLNEEFFEVFEGYQSVESVESLGMHNYSYFDNSDSVLEFRKNYMITPLSVKPFERYTSLHNIAVVVNNNQELRADFRLIKDFLKEFLNNLNYYRFKLDLWALMNGLPENLIANTTDKFEILRLLDKSADFTGNAAEINIIDYIEKVAESVFSYRNLKTIIFITSSANAEELVMQPHLKKLIRFLRNNDINIEILNFNRKTDLTAKQFAAFFSNRYSQYPEISVNNILKFIDEYNSGNYTVFYRNKIRLQSYNRLNQFITLKYFSNTGEIRGGYFIP